MRNYLVELGSKRLVDAVLIGLVSFISALTAVYFLIQPENMAPFWFANGVVLAVLLRRPQRDWPLLLFSTFLGFFINTMLWSFPVHQGFFYGLVNVIEPLTAALIITKFKPRFELKDRHYLGTLIVVSFIACVIGATIAWNVGPIRWALWLMDDWLGMLLITPTLLVFWPFAERFPKFYKPTAKQAFEMAAILFGMLLVSAIFLFKTLTLSAFVYTYALLPFLLWATLRFRLQGATIASISLGVLTLGLAVYGYGPLASLSPMEIDLSLAIQAFLAVVLLSNLTLAVTLTERDFASHIQNIQIKILEHIGGNHTLQQSLNKIVQFVQEQEPGIRCEILLSDVKPAANRVVPIKSNTNEILGTFAVYYLEARRLSEREVFLINVATQLATTAILKNRDEEAIRKSESRLRQLLETTSEGVWTLDYEGKIAYANPSLLEMLGYKHQDIIGKEATEFIAPEDRHIVRENFILWFQGKNHLHELRLLRKDGTIRWVIVAGSPIYNDVGGIDGALGMLTDITVRKSLEKKILFNQRMESLGTLAGGIAHDFNNILTGIIGNAALAKKNLNNETFVKEKLQTVLAAGERAADLVKQILTFSRKQSPARKVTQLKTIVQEACNLLRATLPATIDIRVKCDENLPEVLVDSSQIHQVIMNLGINASHAMAKFGGILEMEVNSLYLDEGIATVQSELPRGYYVSLTVKDTGHGMNEDTLAKIFDPYFTTKGPGHGSGLGLSAVHGIMKDHDAGLTVESQIGRGTKFKLYFPVAIQTTQETKVSVTDTKALGERVLYIDDEVLICEVIEGMLNDLGYKTTAVSSSRKALELIQSQTFDVIVTDSEMPEISGIELIKETTRLNISTPIVLVTGFLRPNLEAEARRLGVVEILTKPFFIKQLPQSLKHVLHKGRDNYADLGRV